MTEYDDMRCRDCGQVIVPRFRSVAKAVTAARHADCYYVCANSECGVSYSNARNAGQRTKIYPRKELNVPAEVRDAIDDVLGKSLNARNRKNKAARFAFETSEDALTWTAIRYLQRSGQVCSALDLPQNEVDSVLIWGADLPGNKDSVVSVALKRVLIHVLGERQNSLTEPDVVVLSGDWLVFVEVKYRSGNSRQREYTHFQRYLDAGPELFVFEPARVKADGYYELVRNWVAGSALARTLRKRFLLVNLTGDGCAVSAAHFAESLEQTPERIFRHLTWTAFLDRLKQPTEPWFASYLEKKGLLSVRAQ